MTVAVYTDVAARIGRPLTTLERGRVEALLQDVEVEIRRLGPDRLTDAAWHDAVVSVECSAVIRAARLPDALNQVIPDIEAAGYQGSPNRQGAVYLYRSERRTLGLPLVGTAQLTPEPVVVTDPLWPIAEDDGWCW